MARKSSIVSDFVADFCELKDKILHIECKLEEFSMRLESNRRATLECILGQQRAEEELRKLRAGDGKSVTRKQWGRITVDAARSDKPATVKGGKK